MVKAIYRLKMTWAALILAWLITVGVVALFCSTTVDLIMATNLYFQSLDDFVPLPKPVFPSEVDLTHSSFIPEAEDLNHNKMSVAIYLLTDEYKWKLGSYERLNDNYERVPFSREMVSLMSEAKEIICVGASSEETVKGLTSEDGRKFEEKRAGLRAETVAKWVNDLHGSALVKKWNIGHWLGRSFDEDTSAQRRVIIILVLKKAEGVNLDEALKNALEREALNHSIYKTILTQYSLTQGSRLTWMR